MFKRQEVNYRKSHQYINEIAELKRQKADLQTLKDRANKFSLLAIDKIKQTEPPKTTSSKKPPMPTVSVASVGQWSTTELKEEPKLELTPSRPAKSRNTLSHAHSVQGSQVPSLPNKFDLLDARNGKFYNYQGIPAFMRSEGPYSTYNHFKLKGEDVHDNSKLTKSNAKQRVHD